MPTLSALPFPTALPAPAALEEVAARAPADMACAVGFALWRALSGAPEDRRPLLVAATATFLNERGAPFGGGARALGLGRERLMLARARRESEVLWALEEALKSGAVRAALGALETPSFVATRRLEFAARAGAARALVLRSRPPGDLSAARLRWHIASLPSASHPLDARAPGAARLEAYLARGPGGVSAHFALEQNDETHRFHLAAGLADHGLAAGQIRAA